MYKKRKKNNSGFSLMELMVVFAIFGVIVVMAMPNFIKRYRSNQAKEYLNSLKSDIMLAKAWAARDQKHYVILFDTTDPEYTVFRDDNKNNALDAGEPYTIRENFNENIEVNFDYEYLVILPKGFINNLTDSAEIETDLDDIKKTLLIRKTGNTYWK